MARKLSALLIISVLSLGLLGCRGGDSSGANINDTERPSDVVNFAAAPDDGELLLSWDAASDNIGVANYQITLLSTSTTITAGGTSYTWSGLTNGQSYTFTIVAVDASGNASANPATISGTPAPPDTTAPTDVTGLNGQGGYHNALTQDYVQLSLWWTGSSSTDLSHYLVYITSDNGNVIHLDQIEDPPTPTDPTYIGNINTIVIPDDGTGFPITQAELTPAVDTFAIGTPYTVRVVAVDTSDNVSAGATVTITPTLSTDTTPPGPVTNLQAVPGNTYVDLTWTAPGDPDVAGYEIYYRAPADDDVTAWTNSGSVSGSTAYTVSALTNGTTYEFMVAAFDGSLNETDGAATADRSDDVAAKTTSTPTSDLILVTPNYKGGVYREGFFTGTDITVMVSTGQASTLDATAATTLYYTLDGSEVDTTAKVNTQTSGYIDFTSAVEVSAGYLYELTIDFDPSVGGTQRIDANTLRPNATDPDHIVLKMIVVGPSDASRLFKETYLIYDVGTDEYLKFSGMQNIRSGSTATYIDGGDTEGDVVYIGGSNFAGVTGNAERYRIAFEHFEDTLGGTAAMTDARTDHTATLLSNGYEILIAGGHDDTNTTGSDATNLTMGLNTYARFSAQSSDDDFTQPGAAMQEVRRFNTATRMYNGEVLITGGLNGDTNILGTVAGPENNLTEDPTQTTIGRAADPGAIVGETVEILDLVTPGLVLQRGVVTNVQFDEGLGRYQITVNGLISDILLNDEYRVINTATATTEMFNTAGTASAADGTMLYPRYGHTATLLQDGTVFIAGGLYDYKNDNDNDFEFTTELYNPVFGSFSDLGYLADLSTTRYFHNAVLLRDGKVLITGGLSKGDHVFKSSGYKGASIQSSAELYDPYTQTVRSVGGMTTSRFGHSSVLLPSGKVLVCGGYVSVTSEGVLVINNTAEIYDPATETFSSTGLMLTPRGRCAMAVIDDSTSPIYGQVVIGGGADTTLAELFNESTGLFSATAHGVTGDRYIGSVATKLKDGTVLISGGQTDSLFEGSTMTAGHFLSSAELYDSSLVKFTLTTGDMTHGRRHHTATEMQDGTVLIAGGENDDGGLSAAELYNPSNKVFNPTADMLQPRYKHTATLMPDGKVFLAGGANVYGSLSTCEIYDPTAGVFNSAPAMSVGRYDHTATLLPNGWILITGGEGIDDDSVEIFDTYTTTFITPLNDDTLVSGRDGHLAVQPQYTIGKARFTNGSTAIDGSDGTEFGLANTAWTSGNVQVGDIIVCVDDGVPYVIGALAANQITIADTADFTYDDSGYSGTSTEQKLTNGNAAAEGYEDYIIYSQDVYIAGGEVMDLSTEVFEFDTGAAEWPAADPTDYQFTAGVNMNAGRYGHALTSLHDMRLLVTGGEFWASGDVSNAPAAANFVGMTWPGAVALDTWAWAFHTTFRLVNNNIIVVKGHSAQAFFSQ